MALATKPVPKKTERSRLFIIDDHPVFRRGLALLLGEEADLEICGEAENATIALEKAVTSQPHLIVVDISLDGMNGIELTKLMREKLPRVPIMILSMYKESLYAERALHAGARGYVMKQEPPERIIAAIREVLSGKVHVSEYIASRVLQRASDGQEKTVSPLDSLSDRELEVFQLIGQGRGTRQIAEQLELSIKTIESYREHIKHKLHLNNAVELMQAAIHWTRNERV